MGQLALNGHPHTQKISPSLSRARADPSASCRRRQRSSRAESARAASGRHGMDNCGSSRPHVSPCQRELPVPLPIASSPATQKMASFYHLGLAALPVWPSGEEAFRPPGSTKKGKGGNGPERPPFFSPSRHRGSQVPLSHARPPRPPSLTSPSHPSSSPSLGTFSPSRTSSIHALTLLSLLLLVLLLIPSPSVAAIGAVRARPR